MKRGYVRPALAGLAAVGIGILSLRAAAVALAPAAPLTIALAPGHPATIQGRAMDELRSEDGITDDGFERAVIASTRAAPLDDRPYVVASVRALKAEDEAAARRLLEETRRLNPRQRLGRLLLLDRYLRAEATEEAAAEMATLNRLIPGTGDIITQELAKMVTAPETRRTAVATLSANPALFDRVLGQLAREGVDPSALDRLAGDRAPRSSAPGSWQRVLIDTLTERREYAAARAQWQRTFGVTAEQANAPIFDARFSGAAGPPFGWSFESSEVGSIDPRDGRIEISYFGRRTGVLGSQLLLLQPGDYVLGFAIEGNDGGEAGSIAVTLQCASPSASAPFATIAAPRLGVAVQQVRARISVPAQDCPAQWLRIGGTAREFAAPTNANISRLSMVRS